MHFRIPNSSFLCVIAHIFPLLLALQHTLQSHSHPHAVPLYLEIVANEHLPIFLGLEQGHDLFSKFSVLFAKALFTEEETLQLIAHPILYLAAQDMQFLTFRLVAEAFDDSLMADSISSQRKDFFTKLKKSFV